MEAKVVLQFDKSDCPTRESMELCLFKLFSLILTFLSPLTRVTFSGFSFLLAVFFLFQDTKPSLQQVPVHS